MQNLVAAISCAAAPSKDLVSYHGYRLFLTAATDKPFSEASQRRAGASAGRLPLREAKVFGPFVDLEWSA
jgi:hypothetical protein